MANVKHWRILFLESNNGESTTLERITLQSAPLTLNLADPSLGGISTNDVGIPHNPFDINDPLTFTTPGGHYVACEFLTNTSIGAYSIKATGLSAPKKWVLESSADGQLWTPRHYVDMEVGWMPDETRNYIAGVFRLPLDVTGSLAARQQQVFVFDSAGILVTQRMVYNGVTDVFVKKMEDLLVTVFQDAGRPWGARQFYVATDLIHPVNSSMKPYYFECIQEGISGYFEPPWNSDAGEITPDGTCRWVVKERLNQPLSQYPIRPIVL